MTIQLKDINRAGLSDDVIKQYQSTDKVKRYIVDIKRGDVFPPIKMYQPVNGLYTIADGIHRLSAYLYLGITSFNITIK